MKRREFITLLGGALGAWPLGARAQQSAMPTVGFLRDEPLVDAQDLVAALRQGLKETGFVEGSNVAIKLGSAEGHRDRLPAMVADLIRRPVTVFVGNTEPALAAKAATKTLPIVFLSGFDPVKNGLVASLNQPGGNVTGVTFLGAVLGAKQLELLHQVVPKATTIGLLVKPISRDTEANRRDVQSAAQAMGQQLIVLDVSSASDLDKAFATFVERKVGAVLMGGGSFFFNNRTQIVVLATRYGLPTCFGVREGVEAGALMSYAPSIRDGYRQAGVYAGRILKGERPADLPVMQSTKFEFVINLKTAKALGLEIPPTLLAVADEVIE